MRKTHKLTESGLQSMRDEYADLETKRKPAVDELAWARDLGDRSENAAYKSARRKLSGIDNRLRYLKRVIENSEVIKPTSVDRVDIGCSVIVNNGVIDVEYQIVGDHEADSPKKRISHKSPIGRSLLGKKVKDKVSISVPSGSIFLVIKEIRIG